MSNIAMRLCVASRQLPRLSQSVAMYHNRQRIGTREVVGFGMNGTYMYIDKVDFPMPAVRFMELTPDIKALQEKEKGDWKNLTIEERKALYRYSFCQTFAEMMAPTGEWKQMISGVLVAFSLTIWIYMWLKVFVYGPMPSTFDPDREQAQLERMILLKINPVEGLTSNYDYEKKRWK